MEEWCRKHNYRGVML